jgi:Fimbrial assembly protein (PilN).
MKTDINLLQKRKAKQYSGQKLALMLLCAVMFAGAVYAGFMFPNSARTAAILTASNLDGDLLSASVTEGDIVKLTERYAQRSEQLKALSAIDSAKSDMSAYINAIESSLPTSANLTYIFAEQETISINGTAEDDEVIAAFCLRLRETGKFREVFLISSVLMEDGTTSFAVDLILPATLDSSAVLPMETGDADAAQTAQITEEVTP